MKKAVALAVIVFMFVGVIAAYAGSSAKTEKASGESGWTKIYQDISNWGKSSKSTGKTCASNCTKPCCAK